MAWPQLNQIGVRANFVDTRKFKCEELGYHRPAQLHVLPLDKSVLFQVCRRCGERKFYKYKVVDGKLTEELLEVNHV